MNADNRSTGQYIYLIFIGLHAIHILQRSGLIGSGYRITARLFDNEHFYLIYIVSAGSIYVLD